jgi:hypothetical protein
MTARTYCQRGGRKEELRIFAEFIIPFWIADILLEGRNLRLRRLPRLYTRDCDGDRKKVAGAFGALFDGPPDVIHVNID